MIYDCFTFFNELDLLELRLKHLYDYVDYFVIVEADHTFSGIKKPFILGENIDRFSKFSDKIIYIKRKFSTINSDAWQQEYDQRNTIAIGIQDAKPDDIIMIGDLDEFPNINVIKSIPNILNSHTHISLQMSYHYYFFNFRKVNGNTWGGITVCKYKNFTTPQTMRNYRCGYFAIPNSGYHFSCLGGVDKIIEKLKAFAHQEYNIPEVCNSDFIKKCIDGCTDIFNRNEKYETYDISADPLYPRVIIKEADRKYFCK